MSVDFVPADRAPVGAPSLRTGGVVSAFPASPGTATATRTPASNPETTRATTAIRILSEMRVHIEIPRRGSQMRGFRLVQKLARNSPELKSRRTLSAPPLEALRVNPPGPLT